MKKMVAIIVSLLTAGCFFAQSFSASRDTFIGVYKAAESNNVIEGNIDILKVEPTTDTVTFNYSWTQVSGKGILASAMQYKIQYIAQSTVTGTDKTFTLTTDEKIFSRSVNADGSEKSGTPKTKGVSYSWTEAKTIFGKTKLIKSVTEKITKQLNEFLSSSDENYKTVSKQILLKNIYKIADRFEKNTLSQFLETKGFANDAEIVTSPAIINAIGYNCGNELQFNRFLEKNHVLNSTVTLHCVVDSVEENNYPYSAMYKSKYVVHAATNDALVIVFTNNDNVIDFNRGKEFDAEGKMFNISFDLTMKILSIYLAN